MSIISRITRTMVLALLAFGAPATAAPEAIEPRVDRRPYTDLITDLELDSDQRLVAEMLYEQYLIDLEELTERQRARAEAAGAERVKQTLAGRIYVEPEELRRLRVGLERTRAAGWEAANANVEELLLNLRSLLPPEMRPAFNDGVRDLHRVVYLHPRRQRERDDDYAGDGVDIVSLVTLALTPGHELDGLSRDHFAATLDVYRDRVDEFLVATAVDERRDCAAAAIARIERNDAARSAAAQTRLERWRVLYDLNRVTVEEIAAEAERALGAEPRRQWMSRFHEACFPKLFRDTMPDRQHDWIARRDLDAGIRENADAIYARYRVSQDELARQAIDLMLRGRIDRRTVVHARVDPGTLHDSASRDLYEALLRNSGERSTLQAATSDRFEALLPQTTRRQMSADIAAAAYGRRR